MMILSRQQLQDSGGRRRRKAGDRSAILDSGESGGGATSMTTSWSYAGGNANLPDEKIRTAGSCSQKNYTLTPFADGYQWRKYGEKKIIGCSFPRSYYRCTYREDKGCQATKQVQQQGHADPPLFLVTLKGEHTCSNSSSSTANLNDPIHLQQYTLQGYQLRQQDSPPPPPPPPRSIYDYGAYGNSNYNIPTTPPTPLHMMEVDSPPDPVSPFDFDFLHSEHRPGGGLDSDSPFAFDSLRFEHQPQGFVPGDAATVPELLTAVDFATFYDEFCQGLPAGSQEFGGGVEDAMLIEPWAFEFDDMESLDVFSIS